MISLNTSLFDTGGEGVEHIQIDESKFGKTKHHHGHSVLYSTKGY
jgi:hypothetical protein